MSSFPKSTLIYNANIWQWDTYASKLNNFNPEGSAKHGAIVITDGIIEEVIIGNDHPDPNLFGTVIDAKGSLILPGLIGKNPLSCFCSCSHLLRLPHPCRFTGRKSTLCEPG